MFKENRTQYYQNAASITVGLQEVNETQQQAAPVAAILSSPSGASFIKGCWELQLQSPVPMRRHNFLNKYLITFPIAIHSLSSPKPLPQPEVQDG